MCAGLHAVEESGKRYLFRSAPAFVRAYLHITPRPLLTPEELLLPRSGGGLVVVGSYVPISTAQLSWLLGHSNIEAVEVEVGKLLEPDQLQRTLHAAVTRTELALRAGRDVVIFTSRELVTGLDAQESLDIVNQVSNSLIQIVRGISVRPRYVLAKGGITSSDVATKGLGIRRGMVLGQLAEGVSVWECGPESRYPGLMYIVFPGNVGETQTLGEVVNSLKS
jgi:uncharacterized protein YgbK (DUF1537 family)